MSTDRFLSMADMMDHFDEFLPLLQAEHVPDDAVSQFRSLYSRFLLSPLSQMNWDQLEGLHDDDVARWSDIARQQPTELQIEELLAKTAILKLNGGLGTSMGCQGPKSIIEVSDGQSFLDLVLRQQDHLMQDYGVCPPLYLMNSAHTHADTLRVVGERASVFTFLQHEFPRIDAKTGRPFNAKNRYDAWYPPGHGDVFLALKTSGALADMTERGIDYLFVSNVDNLGATLNLSVLSYFAQASLDFMMEMTAKTTADVKGGTVVRFNGLLHLLERAQVPSAHLSEFEDIRRFSRFNTNNLWLRVSALNSEAARLTTSLPMIVNPKVVDDRDVVQLETAMGAAVGFFRRSRLLDVPRSRFFPVKLVSDLLLLRSDYVSLNRGAQFQVDATRVDDGRPRVTLDDTYKHMSVFDTLLTVIPSLKALRSLTVTGAFQFGPNVRFSGDVILDSVCSDPHKLQNLSLHNQSLRVDSAGRTTFEPLETRSSQAS